jgi:hypothetical protein
MLLAGALLSQQPNEFKLLLLLGCCLNCHTALPIFHCWKLVLKGQT